MISTSIKRTTALTLLLIMGMMWGLQFSMLKLASQSGHSDTSILVFSLFVWSVIFSIISIVKNQLFRLTSNRIKFLVVIAFLGYIAPLAATLKVAPYISAGILTLVASLTPMVTISVALIFRTESVSAPRIIAVVLGLIAVLLVLWPELNLPSHGATRWMLIGLIVPLSYGIESIYIAKFWPKGLTPLQVLTGEVVVATILLLPFYLLYNESLFPVLSWSSGEIAILIFIAAGIIEVFLYFYLIQQTGGVFVSFGTFISLFAGIFWGMIIFSESHNIFVWVGIVFLLVALILSCINNQLSSGNEPN